MTRRTRIIWTALAAVFTVINVGGAVFAAVAQELIHAGAHVLLGALGMYLTWRIAPRRELDGAEELSAGAVESIPDARLSQLEESVNAVAIEVERIGEGQRFMTKVLTERDALRPDAGGAADAASVERPATPPDTKRR